MTVAPTAPRVLPDAPFESLEHYVEHGGGGAGLDAARKVEAAVVVDEVEASGLRGRGGGGFPTGTKWRAVVASSSAEVPTTVVVNAAEGEPATFKDRMILRANPYAVIEGALIAAYAIGAPEVVIAMKAALDEAGTPDDLGRVRRAVAEADAAGWCGEVTITVFEGPEEYLYGEETALLEVLDGGRPFPRIAPPFREGVDDDDPAVTDAPPALVNNVETLANVPAIVARGAAWFREVGTSESPGTLVCTVTGAVEHDGVLELPMGTPLREAIDVVGGGVARGRTVVGVLNGASNAILAAELLDTPLTYEDMSAAGVGLGSASLIVLDDGDDLAAVAAGFARFLAVESCGQCTPCKSDGLAIADQLAELCAGDAGDDALDVVTSRLSTVADGARCNLARQTETLVGSLVERHPDAFRAHLEGAPAVVPVTVGEIVDIVDGRAVLAPDAGTKQPDWTYDTPWSGTYPAALEDPDDDQP